MKKHLFTLVILASVSYPCFAQTTGYIVLHDTAISYGKVRYNYRTPNMVEHIRGNEKGTTYKAGVATEFKVGNILYKAKQIEVNGKEERVFLQILDEGKVTLYDLGRGKSRFYIEDGNQLHALKKASFRELIGHYTDSCQKRAEGQQLIRYTKNSIRHYFSQFNHGKCSNTPFLSYGISVDYTIAQMKFPEGNYPTEDFYDYALNASSPGVGLFVDIPIWKSTNLSILTDVKYSHYDFTKELLTSIKNQDIRVQMSTLQLNVSGKYTLEKNRVRPYFLLGSSGMFTFDASSEVFQATILGRDVTLGDVVSHFEAPPFYLGINYGIGLQVFYTTNHYFSIDLSGANFFKSDNSRINKQLVNIRLNI